MLLDEIIANKQTELIILRDNFKRIALANLSDAFPPLRDFKSAISRPGKINLIAEIKKASPSAGVLRESFEPITLAKAFEEAGAASLSVLTDYKYFKGALSHLKSAKESTTIPVLRKDFLIDELQLSESRLAGADAVLLIIRVLKAEELKRFLGKCAELGLAAVVEVHNQAEAESALAAQAEIVGINNRDLDTLQVDFNLSFKLLEKLPELKKKILISESGIQSRSQIQELRSAGFQAVLIGETLLKSPDIPAKIQELMS